MTGGHGKMNVEIITIGDELVSGYKSDTNAATIARQLSGIGLSVTNISSVGDGLGAMEDAFKLALRRARIVITTGGLGPTDDDQTKRAIVRVFKRNLIFHEDILAQIKSRFEQRGAQMPALSQNQALLPQGASFFANRFGSAVGICIAEQGKVFISLPGVPVEMTQILTDEVIPYLARLRVDRAVEVVTLRTTGVGETILAEKIAPGLKIDPNVKLAYLPHFGSVDLRVVASAANQADASAKAEKLARHIENSVGNYLYGRDDETLAGVVGQLLKDNDKTLAVAESCTAGQLGMTITDVPGASAYFVGGLLAYADDAKVDHLGVAPELLAEHGAVSEACAEAMARGCRKAFGTDYALSVTGVAGPEGGSEEKPVGTTYIGLASAHTTRSKLFRFGLDRQINRTRAVKTALEMLRREILDLGK